MHCRVHYQQSPVLLSPPVLLQHVAGFDSAAPELADAVETKLDELLAAGVGALDADLATAAATSAAAAVAAATAATAAAAAAVAAGKAPKPVEEPAVYAAEHDPHALHTASRSFNPVVGGGCR